MTDFNKERRAAVEALAFTDDDVLFAVDQACDKTWCYSHDFPGHSPAYHVVDQLLPVDIDPAMRFRFERLAIPALTAALRRLRGQGRLAYTPPRDLWDSDGKRPGIPGGGGLWTVTIHGDEYLGWLEGAVEFGLEAQPIWLEGRDNPATIIDRE